jgi:hypothetical protein
MTPRDNDAIFEFQEETPHARDERRNAGETIVGETPPDGVFRVESEIRAVPRPIQNDIDAFVDAISAGGRPRVTNDLEPVAEADDADIGEFAIVPRELRRQSRIRLMHPAAFRFVGAGIGAFALGTVIAWSVLRSFDATPRSAAVQPPTAIEPAPSSAPTAPPQGVASAPLPVAPLQGRPLPAAPAATARQDRATSVALAVTSRPDRSPAAVARSGSDARRSDSAGGAAITTPRQAAAPRTSPRAPVEAAPAPLASARVIEPLTVPALAAPPPVITTAAAAPLAPPVVVAVSRDRDAVLETVQEYRQAYAAMDVTATAAIWPSVDRRALARAFSTLKSQDLELRDCEVALADASATTRCRGIVEYVRKIGNPTPRTGNQEFVFKMRKLGDDWFIDNVSAVARH